MGDKVHFMAPPPRAGRPVSATGGTGLPFRHHQRAAQPDAAAAYLDFITNTDAMKVTPRPGSLPVVDTAAQQLAGPGVRGAVHRVRLGGARARCCPTWTYATPTMSDTIGAALQEPARGAKTPNSLR